MGVLTPPSSRSSWTGAWLLRNLCGWPLRVRLAVIPSADEALHDLGTLAFVASHLFSTGGGRHSPAVAKIIHLIERLEELQTEVQGMI